MNIIEMVEEIVKHLPTNAFLQFSQTSTRHYKICNQFMNQYVDEEIFFRDHHIRLINRKY